jgi:hypothetical protein
VSTTNSAVKTRSPLSERLDLIISPVFAAALAILGFAVWTYSDLDKITIAILSPDWRNSDSGTYLFDLGCLDRGSGGHLGNPKGLSATKESSGQHPWPGSGASCLRTDCYFLLVYGLGNRHRDSCPGYFFAATGS